MLVPPSTIPVAKTREVLEKTQEAKRNTWRTHLEEVTRTKDAMKAWAVVKSLNGSARAQDGKTLVSKGREYVSDKAKASAFIQEYSTVSGRKSDRSSRWAVRKLRSGVRRLLGSPRQELEQAITLEELAAALKTVAFPGGWRRSRSSDRGKPGSTNADVPPTNASDCPSSLAMAFSRQIRNEPSLCSSIILRHTTLSGEPVCSRRCLISESRCVSCSGRRLGLLIALPTSNSTG